MVVVVLVLALLQYQRVRLGGQGEQVLLLLRSSIDESTYFT
jgi:hypothetical protein